MQSISLSQAPTVQAPQKSAELRPVESVAAGDQPQKAVAPEKVQTRSAAAPVADTYVKPVMAEKTFTNVFSAVDTPEVQAMSNVLSSSVEQRGLNASGFMSQLSVLAGETASFEGEARTAQLSEEAAANGVSPDFSESLSGQRGGRMVAQIRTRDGDVVDVELGLVVNDKGEKSLSFSMSVEGDLSEAELEAIADVAKGLGKVADRFFEDGEAALHELGGLDNDLLGGFSLNLGKGDERLELNYTVSDIDGSMQLDGKYQGYSFDVRREAGHSLVGNSLLENPQYQQYLTLIEESAQAYGTDNEVVRFMKAGMGALFGVDVSVEDSQRNKGGSSAEVVDDFHSNLPDFEASFNSPVLVNKWHPDDVAFMSLSMSQETTLEKTDSGVVSMLQRFDYQQSVHTFEPLEDGRLDLKHGFYVMQQIDRNEEVLRALELDNGRPVLAMETHKGEESLERETKEGFLVVDVEREEDSHAEVINLLEQVDAFGKSASEAQQKQLMDSKVVELFEYSGESRDSADRAVAGRA